MHSWMPNCRPSEGMMSQLETVTEVALAEELKAGSGVVAVDFWAAWCPPCRMAEPVLEEVAQEYASRIRVRIIDTEANPTVTTRFGVRGLPTLVFFRDGVEIGRVVGAVPKPVLRQRFEEVLGLAASP